MSKTLKRDEPILAVTLGDPDGIGPEIILKAWDQLKDTKITFIVFCDYDIMVAQAEQLRMPKPIMICESFNGCDKFSSALPIIPLPSASTAPQAAIRSIEAATRACLSNKTSALVTSPISKSRLWGEGFKFTGHTDFIADLTDHVPSHKPKGPVMMLAASGLRTALVTVHTPLKKAIAALNTERISKVGKITANALKRDFKLSKPRLAVAGLNPHAGENGMLGEEDALIIAPAVEALKDYGIDAFGPLPADTMFHADARKCYDAAVCMYHDQGLIPVKTLDFRPQNKIANSPFNIKYVL